MTALTANISLADIGHTLVGVIGLAPFFLVPGYILNRTTRVFAGQGGNALDTIGTSLALSIGVCPITLYLLGKLAIGGTRAFFWACVLGFLLLAWRKRTGIAHALSKPSIRFCISLALLWLAIALFTQIDWQWNHHVYLSSVMFDDALRIGLVGGIARSHFLPPPDPFLRLGTAIPLGYHYFWFLLCSSICREAPVWVGPRGAMMAGTVWTAFTLWAAFSLWLKKTQNETQNVGRRWAVAALLLSISGLDLAVFGLNIVHRLAIKDPHWIPAPTLDWWSFDQVTNWIDILLWVPHCAGALTACATGLLILTDTVKPGWKHSAIRAVIAGACFASAAGMSIYVAFGFAVFFVVYLIFLGVRKSWVEAGQITGAGSAAFLLAAPYLWETKASTSGQQFFYLALRHPGGVFWLLTSHASRLVQTVAYPLEIALTFVVELGFFLLVLFYWWRMRPSRTSVEHRWMLILLFLTSLIATSILRSDAVGTNDIATRGIFPAQFALALMAGEWLLNRVWTFQHRPTFKVVVKRLPVPAFLLLTAGLLTTGAEIILLRTFAMFQDANKTDSDYTFIKSRNIGLLTADARAAYTWLQQHSHPDTIVQNNPSANWDFLFGLYANRQCVVNGKTLLRYKGTYSPRIRQAIQDLSVLFNGEATAPSDPGSTCARWGVNYLVIKSQDPVWAERNSWMWRTSPVYQNPMVRIYSCSAIADAPTGLVQPATRRTTIPQ